MLIDELLISWRQGGWVMYPILLTGIVAFSLIADALLRIGWANMRGGETRVIQKSLKAFREQGHAAGAAILGKSRSKVAELLRIAYDRPELNEESLRRSIQVQFNRSFRGLDKGLHLIGVLGAIAPLLGLLGTVEGMVKTFGTISTFGNSNPALLSNGISEALIATQTGLLIAFPIILLRQRVVDRVEDIKNAMNRGAQELYLALHEKGDQHERT